MKTTVQIADLRLDPGYRTEREIADFDRARERATGNQQTGALDVPYVNIAALPVVAQRADGGMYVVDGRNRIIAMAERGFRDVDVDLRPMTREEEQRLFIDLNSKAHEPNEPSEQKTLVEAARAVVIAFDNGRGMDTAIQTLAELVGLGDTFRH